MRNLIFIFATLLTLIIPPVNQKTTPKESGPLVFASAKVVKLAPLPAPKIDTLATLELVYVAPAVVEAPAPAPVAAPVAAPAPVADTSGGCGDNYMANYIYMHESGCNPQSVNSIGCIGIGQSCSPSVLRAACPALDYSCENIFFTNYANSRYGGWGGAYSFWTQNHWW